MAQNVGSDVAVASLHLPDEIIGQLLFYVSPRDNLVSLQCVSRRFYRIANEPLLWKHHCCSHFRFWHPRHRFHEKKTRPSEETNWKRLFILRKSQNKRIATLLDDIISTRVGRLQQFQLITELGYDAKDFLLEQCQADPLLDDGLARRYYSNAILDGIHRSMAIEEWYSLERVHNQQTTEVMGHKLERALGAFDLFVLHDQPGDLNDITRMLDEVASSFRFSQPDLEELTTRGKALSLLRWLRAQNLVGLQDPERDYRNMRNCLIGQALRHEKHESIPVISSAIFCCVASRLGIDARCCAFPSHVHVIIFPTAEYTLDDVPLGLGLGQQERNVPPQRMFLDPYGSDDEIPLYVFQAMLGQLGWQDNLEELLAPTPVEEIAKRTAMNLKATIAKIRNHAHPELSRLIRGHNTMNAKAGLYAASWATLMLSPPNTLEWVYQLATFLRNFVDMWPEDAWLVEKYLMPPYSRNIRMSGEFLFHAHRVLKDPWRHWLNAREQDERAPNMLRRQRRDSLNPPFKIGQVFRHRRYGWTGVITSWSDMGPRHSSMASLEDDDDDDDGSESRLNIDRRSFLLARAGHGYYFSCLPSDGSESHVVVAPNIELISDATLITEDMFPLAGKYFKRFDSKTCTFISNIKEQFPDD